MVRTEDQLLAIPLHVTLALLQHKAGFVVQGDLMQTCSGFTRDAIITGLARLDYAIEDFQGLWMYTEAMCATTFTELVVYRQEENFVSSAASWLTLLEEYSLEQHFPEPKSWRQFFFKILRHVMRCAAFTDATQSYLISRIDDVPQAETAQLRQIVANVHRLKFDVPVSMEVQEELLHDMLSTIDAWCRLA